MSGTNTNDQDDKELSINSGRPPGFLLGLSPPSLPNLLDGLSEVCVSDLPPPATAVDRTISSDQNGKRPYLKMDLRRQLDDWECELASNQCRIDTRTSDNALLIVADLPTVANDDLVVGINPKANRFVIKTNEKVVGDVELPWKLSEVTHARFNNSVLEVRVQSTEV